MGICSSLARDGGERPSLAREGGEAAVFRAASGGAVLGCAPGPGPRGLLSWTDGGAVSYHDGLQRGRVVRSWKAHAKGVTSVCCEEGVLATGCRGSALKCWRLDEAFLEQNGDKTAFFEQEQAHELSISAVAVDASRQQQLVVASGSRDTSIKIWDVGQLSCVCTGRVPRNVVTCARFCQQQGRPLLVQGSEDLSVKLWDWERLGLFRPANELKGYVYFPTCLEASDGSHIVVTGTKGFDGDGALVYVWDLRNCSAPVLKLAGHQQEVVGCAVSTDSRSVFSVSKDHTAISWSLIGDPLQQAQHRVAALGFDSPCTGLAVSKSDDDLLISSLHGEYAYTNGAFEGLTSQVQTQPMLSGLLKT